MKEQGWRSVVVSCKHMCGSDGSDRCGPKVVTSGFHQLRSKATFAAAAAEVFGGSDEESGDSPPRIEVARVDQPQLPPPVRASSFALSR